MTDTLARYDDPDFPAERPKEIRSRITPELLEEIRRVSGIETDDDSLRHRLGKDLRRYQAAVRQAYEPVNPSQIRELRSLQKAAERFSKAIEKLNERNVFDIDYAIQYRPPFNGKFNFPEQEDYWEANGNSTQRAQNLAKMISWSIDRVFDEREEEKSPTKRTLNTPLDHLIQDLTTAFRNGTGESPKRHCHYHPIEEAYTGRYFDFVLIILKAFAVKSFHSEVALGKRIVRVLRDMNS
ncbi:hypothetical protein O2N63_00045 [Aliiroseovarius sp. KMU-50]|uniref:Uncharacterized protein n=1 Tax=Aliiroseovarius salicola TaxID=3009082 RepID=A0ABT4VWB7_9RHOB|nr:hypothetical protein [Aliiroseovarius sp. KMU-50]MDA5092479.1 hypothetical protein [Aliiroseovarius sp. KMU-50]